MKARRLFSLLYIVALVFIVLFIAREKIGIPEQTAQIFYFVAIGIFVIGIGRILYLFMKR
jgi:drug/metabolite transporter (DMT)-like permease